MIANQSVSLEKRPSSNTIYRLGNKIKKFLFEQDDYYYHTDDIILLLNYVSKDDKIPNTLKILWGDAITSMITIKESIHKIGVRGNKLKQQNKQSIISSLIILDDNNKILNEGIVQQMIPQKGRTNKKNFIKHCKQIKRNFILGNTDILCDDYKNDVVNRNS